MSISEPSNRYSVVNGKNKREILLLRGFGCAYKRCTFCDYHMDASKDADANYEINKKEIEKVTGIYKRLEVINSGSFNELDDKTIESIREKCVEKGIEEIHFECHWIYRNSIKQLREYFLEKGVVLKLRMGVETFDYDFRENVLLKGISEKDPEKIREFADYICLLFGIKGQTLQSMTYDIETGLRLFERITINIMIKNSTDVEPDDDVIKLFMDNLYEKYKDDERVEIMLENTDLGVGDKYEE